MAKSDKEESFASKLTMAILVPVAIALIAGGTSPWWWSEIFAVEQPVPEQDQETQAEPEEISREADQAFLEAEQRGQERTDYREVDLRKFTRRGFPLQGTDPREMTFNILGRASLEEGEQPSVVERQSFIEYSVVTITNNGMADDSVGAERYRLEFEQIDDRRWQIVWAGAQQRCWRAEDPQAWTAQLCP
ncbi:MAG: hypothetical protein AAF716_21720 [Cyanobacteria bacterium P01_D01_bin.1]